MSDSPPSPRPSRPPPTPRPEPAAGVRPNRPAPAPRQAPTPQPRPTGATPTPSPTPATRSRAAVEPTTIHAPAAAARPSEGGFGTPAARQTLVPPCLVLGVAGLGLGGGYFLQPSDAALRQLSTGIPIALIAAGLLSLSVAGLLAWSLQGER